MFNLQKHEKTIIIFLVFTLLLGLSVAACRKSNSGIKIDVRSGDVNPLPEGPTVNINEAGPDELMKIKGIGKALAGRIVEYRSRNGLFTSVDDVKKVKGIGRSLFEKIKDRISVE